VLANYLSPLAGRSVLEIGSAPGTNLIRMHREYGLLPYGVEYSETGAARNREAFAAAGLSADHVIQEDFFSDRFQATHAGRFDVVASFGFIEHFDDVRTVVEKHLALLKDGGLLVVSIPRLTGVYRVLCWLFHREVIAGHNLEIMDRESFARLFPADALEILRCDYFGAFSFSLLNTKRPSGLRHLVLRACRAMQIPLDVLFRLTLRDKGMASRTLSPHLLFVGVKRSQPEPCLK
jgi:SAM-dependent methyltransferase